MINTQLTANHLSTEHLGHLGIIAATIQRLGLIAKVDKHLPVSKPRGAHLTMGERVAGMILNGLGFLNDRLYMHTDFFENKPVARLFGSHVQANHFTDDALGRCLDAIHDYGSSELFANIALEVGQEHGLLGRTQHIDTTSLSVYGDYTMCEHEGYPDLIVTHGHAKNKRVDLKQVVLSLTMTGDAHLPIWHESLDGNSSDQKSLREGIRAMRKFSRELEKMPDLLHVADSALYTQSHLLSAKDYRWLTRVPERIKEAKALCETPDEQLCWEPLGKGYKKVDVSSCYGGIEQRWQLIFSEQAYAREEKTWEKRLAEQRNKHEKALWHLGNTVYQCEKDAQKALQTATKVMKLHRVESSIVQETGYAKKGRPKAEDKPVLLGYKIQATLHDDLAAQAAKRNCLGRFVLATNDLDEQRLPTIEMLPEYKGQRHNERGFQFIKDKTFCVSSIFLKKPGRIDSLMMVMTLCLMVYNLAQYELRRVLDEQGEMLPNQLGKPTDKPTLKWIFRQLDAITVVRLWDEDSQVSRDIVANMTPLRRKIICLFGIHAQYIYDVTSPPG